MSTRGEPQPQVSSRSGSNLVDGASASPPATIITGENPAYSASFRANRAHYNELEAAVPFIFTLLAWMYAGHSSLNANSDSCVDVAPFLIIIFFVFRLGHSICALRAIQPWRSIFFMLAMFTTIIFGILSIVAVFQ